MLTFGLRGLGALPTLVNRDITQVTEAVVTAAPQAGQCSADGRYVWATTDQGAGYWRRRNADEPCAGTSTNEAPDVRTGGGGGVSVQSYLNYAGLKQLWVDQQRAQTGAQIQELVAQAAYLPPCSPESADGANGECFSKSRIVDLQSLAAAPGTFFVLDVPFHVGELQPTGFEKAVKTTPELKLILDYWIARVSVEMYEKLPGLYPSYSINKMLEKKSDLRTQIDGFGYNPIPPTPHEMTQSGGYVNWLRRGGFPLSAAVASGQTPVIKKGAINTCASIKCACPVTEAQIAAWRSVGWIAQDQQVFALPRCIGGSITKRGIQTDLSNGDQIYWNVHVAIDPLDPSMRVMRLVPVNPEWLNTAAGWIGEQFQKLAGIFCAAQPSVKEQLDTTTAEKCVDKQQKPCTKGAPGCVCIKPPASAQIGVNLFNGWAAHWCGSWAEETAPNPVYTPPAMPEVPPEMQVPPPMPWWQFGLVAGAGLLIGSQLFMRRGQ